MSRRTRRARRQLRRGDARREPLLLVADDRPDLIEWIELAARVGYRYRSELAPFAVAAALLARRGDPARQPAPALVGAAWPPLPVAGGLCWPRVAPLLRPIERGYAVAVTVLSGGWLAAAVALGPDTPPLPLMLLVGTVVGGVPWWAHRRRRAKVRVERTLDAWPDITAAIGLPGSRIMSAVVDRWGWRARIGLPPGTTATDLINATARARIRARHPAGRRAGRARPRPRRPRHHPRPDRRPARPPDPLPDRGPRRAPQRHRPDPARRVRGRPTRHACRLPHRHGLLGGVAGSGKSGVLNVILADLVACPDVVLWGIDLKGGMELRPWAACLDRLATTPAEAAALLADAVAVLDARARAHGRRRLPAVGAHPARARAGHRDRRVRRTRRRSTRRVSTPTPSPAAAGPSPSPCSPPPNAPRRRPWAPAPCARRWTSGSACGYGNAATSTSSSAKACSPPAGTPHTLNAPGKFLISTPEHTTRAEPAPTASPTRTSPPSPPATPTSGRSSTRSPPRRRRPATPTQPSSTTPTATPTDPDDRALDGAPRRPAEGCSVPELMAATGMGRTWVYDRLQAHAAAGRVTQVTRGRWRAADRQTPR